MSNVSSIDERPRAWHASWIGRAGKVVRQSAQVLAAPYFRRTFVLPRPAVQAKVYWCGVGYGTLYINGRKVGEGVLDPAPTHYDKRVRYLAHDVSEYLKEGKNVLGAILGNGWYNCQEPDAWGFDKAAWRDYPKMILQLELDGEPVLVSDEEWKVTSGPILFDGLRNGETYDSRLEIDGWLSDDFDDSRWDYCGRVPGPGGNLELQTMPPCKVVWTLPSAESWTLPGGEVVYDFGQNLTGWVNMTVRGEPGAEIEIRYGERLTEDRRLDQEHISKFITAGQKRCQKDVYILRGAEQESWHPQFTYHGFQYAQISCTGTVRLENMEACVIHTAFAQAGSFSCSSEDLNRLQECTLWSYIGNFVGMPTDCPHREKNGWTGDAHLAAETGLWNYDSASSYAQWIENIEDAQRPSGQLPGIIPTSGWGYNWGSGPAWDSAFLLIPWYIYLYTGNLTAIANHYAAMRRYVEFCSSMACEFIVEFGLGDWCGVAGKPVAETALTSTSYYYKDACLLSKFAALTGRDVDQRRYAELAEKIRQAFNRRFYKGHGIYGGGEQTSLACALYQGLVDESEKPKVIARLVDSVICAGTKPEFGILGAKFVPRALSENGHVELAYRLITQPDYPGWMHWLKRGATTLWEDWAGENSLNHIMFGDVSAWMYQYLAGIAPDVRQPGFGHIHIHPNIVPGVAWVRGEHQIAAGRIASSWTVENKTFELDIEIPQSCTATVYLPDGKQCDVNPGKHHLELIMPN